MQREVHGMNEDVGTKLNVCKIANKDKPVVKEISGKQKKPAPEVQSKHPFI